MDNLVSRYQSLIQSYKVWLSGYPSDDYLSKWNKSLKNDPEAAIAEAWVWEKIHPPNHTVKPNDPPKIGGPDFRCDPVKPGGVPFYIEVTNLDSVSLGKRSKLPQRIEDWQGGGVTFLHKKFRGEREKKQKQLQNINEPALIAITAFHETATFVYFERDIAQELLVPPYNAHWDNQNQCRKEYIFNHNLFFKRGNGNNLFDSVCPEVSGVLLCNTQWVNTFTKSLLCWLVLNPTAMYPFNPHWLPCIPCCKLQSGWQTVDPCHWSVQWINDTDSTGCN